MGFGVGCGGVVVVGAGCGEREAGRNVGFYDGLDAAESEEVFVGGEEGFEKGGGEESDKDGVDGCEHYYRELTGGGGEVGVEIGVGGEEAKRGGVGEGGDCVEGEVLGFGGEVEWAGLGDVGC